MWRYYVVYSIGTILLLYNFIRIWDVHSIVDGDDDDDDEEDTAKRKTSNDDGIISISIPTTSNSNQHLTINANQLAINAGTMGQLLMMKQLSEPNTKAAVEESSMIAAQSSSIRNEYRLESDAG